MIRPNQQEVYMKLGGLLATITRFYAMGLHCCQPVYRYGAAQHPPVAAPGAQQWQATDTFAKVIQRSSTQIGVDTRPANEAGEGSNNNAQRSFGVADESKQQHVLVRLTQQADIALSKRISTATTSSLQEHHPVFSGFSRSMAFLDKKKTMEVSVVPTVVLHFHGFRVPLLSNLSETLWKVTFGIMKKVLWLASAYVVSVVMIQVVRLVAAMFFNMLVTLLIAFATFSTYTMLARGILAEQKDLLMASHKEFFITPQQPSTQRSKLPKLSVTPTKAPSTTEPFTYTVKNAEGAPVKISSVRRRVLNNLRRGPPIVNVVAGETRRRAEMSLYQARIRVGKAHMCAFPGTGKEVDTYLVRVDCGVPNGQEKHMNPVIMWDISATFDEFKKLERELKQEVKKKHSGRHIKVPHLSSGAILFVQRELTDHVLNARRQKIQAFVDAIRTDEVLASMDAVRKFCQAY